MTDRIWQPIDDDEAADLIGEGVHTGLRKGSDAHDAMDLWRAIRDSDSTAWSDAIAFAIDGLDYMGFRICRETTRPKGR